MKYNTSITYRSDIASYTRKNREKSIFYLTHYIYRYTSFSFHMFYLLLIYKILTIIETIEHLSNIYRTSIGPLSNHYRTIIEHLSDHYCITIEHQTSIKLLLNIYQILIHFMKYNTDIMYRADIASYTKKNREKSIFYLTHYTY